MELSLSSRTTRSGVSNGTTKDSDIFQNCAARPDSFWRLSGSCWLQLSWSSLMAKMNKPHSCVIGHSEMTRASMIDPHHSGDSTVTAICRMFSCRAHESSSSFPVGHERCLHYRVFDRSL